MTTKYYSQCQQDKILNEFFFKDNKNGIFFDVGAHDGKTISNSYFFEKELNWTGVCFEPIPNIFNKLKENRSCICLNKAVYNENTTIDFMHNEGYTEMLSGIISTYDEKHKNRIKNEINYYGGSSQILQVETIKLVDVINNYNFSTIDYLSIDTEGSELQVLEGIDFTQIHINIIGIEVNYDGSADHLKIKQILQNNNFSLWNRLGSDEIYVNNILKYSWNNK